jgi:hypothetical protein
MFFFGLKESKVRRKSTSKSAKTLIATLGERKSLKQEQSQKQKPKKKVEERKDVKRKEIRRKETKGSKEIISQRKKAKRQETGEKKKSFSDLYYNNIFGTFKRCPVVVIVITRC